jgi:hypothetical protein
MPPWGSLNALNNPSTGNIAVSIAANGNNMFAPTSPSFVGNESATLSNLGSTVTCQISVKFDYTGGVTYAQGSTFTLTFGI